MRVLGSFVVEMVNGVKRGVVLATGAFALVACVGCAGGTDNSGPAPFQPGGSTGGGGGDDVGTATVTGLPPAGTFTAGSTMPPPDTGPTMSASGDPTEDPTEDGESSGGISDTDDPTDDPSGDPTDDPSGDPTDDPTDDSDTGSEVVPQPCEMITFDAGVPNTWNELESSVTLEAGGGELEFAMPTSVGFGILQYGGPVDFADMFLRVRVTDFTASVGGTVFGLNFDTGAGTESVALQLQAGNVEANHTVPGEPSDTVLSPAPALPFFVQLRAEGGQLHYETSPNGVTWTLLRSIARPGFLDDANLNIVGGNWMSVAQSNTAAIDELEVCLVD